MNIDKIVNELYTIISNTNYRLLQIWETKVLFSWVWWLCVILSILPWILWIKFRNKKETVRLLFVGLVVMIVTSTLDNIGLAFNAWHYESNVFPVASIGFPWDFTLFPVGIMVILQFFPKINAYIKSVVFALVTAFVYEPFFTWIGIYYPVNWRHSYSFVIYIPLYLFFNCIYKSKLFEKK